MTSDFDHEAYRREIARKAAEAVDGFTSRPAGKYRPSKGSVGPSSWEPVYYPGCTILAKPFPLEELCAPLVNLQEHLRRRSTAFAPVPPETFHVTIADLIAGPEYADLKARGLDRAAQERVVALISAHRLRHPVAASICHVGAFPGVVVALVNFGAVRDYLAIRAFRDAIYADSDLIRLGIARHFPFVGHVTIGYVEAADPNGIAEAVHDIRKVQFDRGFPLEGVGLFEFTNMSSYEEVA